MKYFKIIFFFIFPFDNDADEQFEHVEAMR